METENRQFFSEIFNSLFYLRIVFCNNLIAFAQARKSANVEA